MTYPRPVVLLLLGLLSVQATPAAAQRPADLSALDATFAQALKDWTVPGAAVAIVKGGKVVLAKGYGVRETDKPAPVDDRTLCAIASNTKAFASAAMARPASGTAHTMAAAGGAISSVTRFPTTHFRSYGLGWNLWDCRGRRMIDHGGAYDGMFSHVTPVPEEQLGFVILTNSTTSIADALSYSILDAHLGADGHDWSRDVLERSKKSEAEAAARAAQRQKARAVDTKPSLALDAYAGTYGGDLHGDATVTVESGGLVLRLTPNPDMLADLSHWHSDTFLITWRKPFPWWGDGWVPFLMDNRGTVTELRLDVPNDDFWFWEPELRRK